MCAAMYSNAQKRKYKHVYFSLVQIKSSVYVREKMDGTKRMERIV